MLLTISGDKFIFECAFEEAHIPRNMGFVWWSLVENKWATKNPYLAVRLYNYADEKTKQALADIKKEQEENVAASSAISGSDAVPVPPGMSLLPFQVASVSYITRRLSS